MLDPKEDMYTPYRLEIMERADLKDETIFEIKFSEVHFFNNLPAPNRAYILREITQNQSIHSAKWDSLLYHIYNFNLLRKGKTEYPYVEKGSWVGKNKEYAIYAFTISDALSPFVAHWQKGMAWYTENGVYEDEDE
jgi:hypothetical protein